MIFITLQESASLNGYVLLQAEVNIFGVHLKSQYQDKVPFSCCIHVVCKAYLQLQDGQGWNTSKLNDPIDIPFFPFLSLLRTAEHKFMTVMFSFSIFLLLGMIIILTLQPHRYNPWILIILIVYSHFHFTRDI